MFAQALHPSILEPLALDELLSKGWFRMNQSIFTTNFIRFNNELYSTIWLRINLDDYTPTSTHKKISKLNSSFRTEIKIASINQEKEELNRLYKKGISFETSESLIDLLGGQNSENSIYTTYEICVYDKKQLIALGYFDLGKISAAGITCVYNPAYKKFSLGKYLMYLKIEYCKRLNLTYFYPGYFVPGYKLFDYKLELAKEQLEYFNLQKQQWISSKNYSDKNNPLFLMKYKLMLLKELLIQNGQEFSILNYKFFDASLLPNIYIAHLLDFPLFMFLVDIDENNMMPLIVFNVRFNKYQIIQCMSVWQTDISTAQPEQYASNLLQNIEVLFEDENMNEIAQFLVGAF